MEMRLLLLASGTILAAGLLVTIGALQLWSPDLYLRFYDFLNAGMRWNKGAEWRRNIHSKQSRALGLLFLMFGLFIGLLALTRLLSKG